MPRDPEKEHATDKSKSKYNINMEKRQNKNKSIFCLTICSAGSTDNPAYILIDLGEEKHVAGVTIYKDDTRKYQEYLVLA